LTAKHPDLPAPGKAPCGTCPYRRDVPAGVWSVEEYLKLPEYDGETFEQINAIGLFYCHQQPHKLCAGWVGCHDMTQALAVRIRPIAPEAYDYVSPVPLFSSGAEAAAHGLSGINNPDARARAAIKKLMTKFGRIENASRRS
jgi:hypothetical protein